MDSYSDIGAPAPDLPTARRWPQPGELWSLWDVMKVLGLSPVVAVGEEMRRVREMYFGADNYKKVMPVGEHGGMTDEFRRDIKDVLGEMATLMEQIEVPEIARFMRGHTDEDELPDNVRIFDTVCKAFWDGAYSKQVYFLNRREGGFYEMPFTGFNLNVFTVFNNVREEIAQASRCLAFGLSTAAVCHVMRAMERAVAKMASHLGSTNVDKEWGKLLADIQTHIKGRPDQKKWSAVCDHLWNVKEAVRNDTFHARDQGHTQGEGEEIFQRTRSFMNHAAALMAPPPPPKAAPSPAPSGKPVPGRPIAKP